MIVRQIKKGKKLLMLNRLGGEYRVRAALGSRDREKGECVIGGVRIKVRGEKSLRRATPALNLLAKRK